jgi:gliding motility-associated-like protein
MKKYILICLLLISCLQVRASHIIGGEIYYDYLGNNNYRIYIAIYRDCNSTGAPFDTPMILTVFNAANQQYQNHEVPFTGSQNLPVIFSNPCVSPPNNICAERSIYQQVINLPPSPGGYTVSYQRCCRGPNVTNLNNPEDTGLTLATHITGTASNALVNSSPRFTNYPPLVLCNNENLNFDHSATDPDGDQLIYELVTPFAGATDFQPAPNPIPAPPYNQVGWATGFNAIGPLGTAANITINPDTGHLFADPEMLGLFVVGIRVRELRNGVEIGSTTRDFLFRVVNCIINLQASVTPQEDMVTFVSYCQGTTVTFDNQSFGGSTYAWDFGVPNITTDVSTAFEPTYNFPGPGIYNIRLIVNPGWPCTDTSVQVFHVYEHMDIDYTVPDSVCIVNNSFDFDGHFAGPALSTFDWNFGPNASISASTQLDVNNVSFDTAGFITVTLSSDFETCHETFTDSIYIYPEVIAGFNMPTNIECQGLTVTFTNTSQSTQVFDWDFGVVGSITDVSTAVNPTFTFPTSGTYTIRLIAHSAGPACTDTIFHTISVYEPLSVSFVHTDSLCITGNSFNFDGSMTGPAITVFNWDFGPNASLATATTLDVSNVVFDTSGILPITLTAMHHNCIATATSTIRIFMEPTIDFGIFPGLRCAPFPASFVDSSRSDSPLIYNWNFGDGTSSTQQNPVHLYLEAGDYSVSLTITTTFGCIRTLTKLKPAFIHINPSPSSDFSLTPDLTNICNSRVQFTDLSIGASDEILYVFDDGNATSFGIANPAHVYLTSGQKHVMQVVINEFNCRDTSYHDLSIEPYTVYIPNAFTPDEDRFNNRFQPVVVLPANVWRFRIYNRWGQLLFESYDQSESWDGTYNGKVMQDGIYAYIVDFTSCAPQAQPEQITGHVSLLR